MVLQSSAFALLKVVDFINGSSSSGTMGPFPLGCAVSNRHLGQRDVLEAGLGTKKALLAGPFAVMSKKSSPKSSHEAFFQCFLLRNLEFYSS